MIFTDDEIQMIRSERKVFEETEQIPEHLLEFIYEEKLFKLFVPEAFGGRMLDLSRAVAIFQEASRIDGNFGWAVTIGSGGGMFVPNMKEAVVDNMYAPPDAVIAGSGFPAGTAEETDGGYIVNGKWFYCSGSQYATVFTATCVDESNQIIAAALAPEQVTVIEDWDAFGLQGTTSHTIHVKDQFVPHERMFSVFEDQNDYGELIHTVPFMMFSEASFAAISLGIGKHFLEEVGSIVEQNKEQWNKGAHNRYAFLNEKLREEEARWNRANDTFHDIVKLSWDQHVQGKELSQEFQQEFSTIAKRSATTAIHCSNNLFRHMGMHAVMEGNALNQIWRDLQTAAQHTFLTPIKTIDSTPY